MFCVVHFPQFPLQAALRHEPELWLRSVALVDPALSTPRVCDMTGPARTLGIEAGLTPTQALARCREILIRHRSAGLENAATAAALQMVAGFSPHLEHTAPGTITLDLHGLSELTGPEPAPGVTRLQHWTRRLQQAMASLTLSARVGVGATPNIARHAAYWSPLHQDSAAAQSTIQIVEDSTAFIQSLPVASLHPSTDVAGILQKWGIRTVGEFLALGQGELMERLGLEAIALFAAASTRETRPLQLVRPPEDYEEMFEFEHEVETVEPLLFLLRRFVDSIGQRLEAGGFAASLLTLRLRLESGALLERALSVPQPTRRPDILFRMLQTHLESLRTDSAIVSLSLKVDPAEPAQRQFSLFEAALCDPHQFQETLARLSALLGADRVGTPVRENSHHPDAFTLVPPDFENAPPRPETAHPRTPKLLRAAPLRRLRPAVPAIVETGSPIPGPGRPRNNPEPAPARVRSNIVELIGPLFSAPEASGPTPTPAPPIGPTPKVSHPAPAPAEPDWAAPIAVQCALARGRLTVALGPWRSSGRWWEPGAWRRDEWDVQARDGQGLRLVQRPEGWFVEAIVD